MSDHPKDLIIQKLDAASCMLVMHKDGFLTLPEPLAAANPGGQPMT